MILLDFPYGSNMVATALGITFCIQCRKKGGRDETCRCSLYEEKQHFLRNALMIFTYISFANIVISGHSCYKEDGERKWLGSEEGIGDHAYSLTPLPFS